MHQITKLGEEEMGSGKPEEAINIITAGLIRYSVCLAAEKSVSKLQKTEMH